MDVAGNTLRDGSAGTIDRIRFQATGASTVASTGASAAPYFAQVLVSTEPTIGARVHTLPLTGFGATNEWAGAIGNINGIDLDETTLLTTDAPATVLFAKATMAPIDTATERVSAVILSHWSLADLASVQQALVPIARLDGANHAGTPMALSPSFRTRQQAFADNPATGSAWTVPKINTAEFGLRAE